MALHTTRVVFLLLALVAVFYLWPRSAEGEAHSATSYLDSRLSDADAKHAASSDAKTIRRKVVAVADLHGDLDHAHSVLRMAGIIDSSNRWSGGNSVLVSTGDIVDRGDDTIALYQMFDRLRDEAAASGGEVRNCIGNHEQMNGLGDWRYVTRGDVESFGGVAARREAISSSGWIGKTWLGNYSITHTVPLLPPDQVPGSGSSGASGGRVAKYQIPQASFVHGGITAEWARRGADEINRIGRSLLLRALSEKTPSGHPPPSTPQEEIQLYDADGPLWYRGYATDADEARICAEASAAAEALGARHLIMGHTPHLEGFVVRCEGAKIILIDTGISKAYGGEQSALVLDTELKLLGPGSDGVSNKYQESQTLTALYKGRRPKVIYNASRNMYIY